MEGESREFVPWFCLKEGLQELLAGTPKTEPVPVLSNTQLSDFKCVKHGQHPSNDPFLLRLARACLSFNHRALGSSHETVTPSWPTSAYTQTQQAYVHLPAVGRPGWGLDCAAKGRKH